MNNFTSQVDLQQTNLDLALSLAGQGWHVFPCKPDKSPYTQHGKDDSTLDPEQLRAWWGRLPDALIGIYCQKSGIFALDIDCKDGRDGVRSWAELVESHGSGRDVEAGPIQQTPSGGYHILFRLPEGLSIPNNANRLGPGLDLRSNGYVCSGGPYVWMPDHGPDTPLTDAPAWLLELIRNLDRKPESDETGVSFETRPVVAYDSGDAGAYWLLKALDQASPGNRNDTGFWLACQLRDDGMSESEARGVLLDYARSAPGDGYGEREALASLAQAFKAPRREPAHLAGITISLNGNGYYPRSEIPDPPDNLPPAAEPGEADPVAAQKGSKPKVRRRDPRGAEYVAFLGGRGYDFRLCELDDSLWVNNERMSDPLEAEIRTVLRDNGLTKVNVAADAYLASARKCSFHPVRDYLNSLQWDGLDHIQEFSSYFADKHGNFPLALRKWLIGAIARVMTGGKQNRVLVLEGIQGIGKSYLARWFGSPMDAYFSEAMPNPDDKDSRLALATTWIWEIKELGSVTRRADRDALKAWLTLESVTERPPFGKHPIFKPAITSFIATVNDEGGFFNDPTGSRRYMTVAVQSINWAYSEVMDCNQLWAQAYELFKSGEDWNLTPEEQAKLEAVNDEYEFTLPTHDWLDRFAEEKSGVFTQSDEILQAMKAAGTSGSDTHISREIAGWMKKHGYEGGRAFVDVDIAGEDGRPTTVQKRVRGYFGVALQHKPVFSLNREVDR